MTATWADTFASTRNQFGGQQPTTILEAQLVALWRQHPDEFVRTADRLAARYQAGKIHSPWPILANELSRIGERETIKPAATDDELCDHCGILLRRNLHAVGCPSLGDDFGAA